MVGKFLCPPRNSTDGRNDFAGFNTIPRQYPIHSSRFFCRCPGGSRTVIDQPVVKNVLKRLAIRGGAYVALLEQVSPLM
uniref:Uncharacterized protein n=1 Tax=Daphnia magna TaxID=35525 RepID=A0A0P6EI03_9CRUS